MGIWIKMPLLKLFGALLLLVSCGGLGAARVAALRRSVEDTAELRRAVERMETEICVRCRSLPETAKLLETAFPRFFSGMGDMDSSLRDAPFSQVWMGYFRNMELPTDTEKAVCALGEDLSAGAKPEAAFKLCLQQLSSAESELRNKLEKNGRVYIASGLAAGCLLVIAAL